VRIVFALLYFFATSHHVFAAKVDVQCAVDQRTEAHQCIALSELRESQGIRSAPLYSGGPKEINRTPYTVAVNCDTKVLHLKDRQGVSFGGGSFGADAPTKMVRDLGALICNAQVRGTKTK
jgi:hypothetical protein